MKNNTEITQIVFNTITLAWTLSVSIRGCNTNLSITGDEASSIINSFREKDEDNRVEIKEINGSVYYMPRPLK